MSKLNWAKLWKCICYKEVEVHVIDLIGGVGVSKQFYKELETRASLSTAPNIHSFYGVSIVQSEYLPYKETRKRFSL
jgi:hypothetical protein